MIVTVRVDFKERRRSSLFDVSRNGCRARKVTGISEALKYHLVFKEK